MSKFKPSLVGKVIETHAEQARNPEFVVGKRLRSLREITGLNKSQVASSLGVKVSDLTKLESSSDLTLEIIRSYVESLGATLKVNACFETNSNVGFRIMDAFDLDFVDESQLLLPIFGEEDFRPQRDVVLSIKPQYSSKIIVGEKTVELRRRFPINVPAGTIAYIYSTTPDKALVGFAEIGSVSKKAISDIWRDHKSEACIRKKDFDDYFCGQEFGFAVSFIRAKALKKSIELEELRERFGFEPPQSFLYAKPLLREAMKHELTELSH